MKKIFNLIYKFLYYTSSLIILTWFVYGILSAFIGYTLFSTAYGFEATTTFWVSYGVIFSTFIPILPISFIILFIELINKIKHKKIISNNFFKSIEYNIIILILPIIVLIICFMANVQI